jgi:hypothetical protein
MRGDAFERRARCLLERRIAVDRRWKIHEEADANPRQ